MIKLDSYDRKILEILIENSRIALTEMSKKVKLKRENVNYKINRLIKLGLIKEFNTIFNEQKLQLKHYVVFLQLINIDADSEKKILDYLKNNNYMSWIGTAAGKWSLIFDIILSEKENLNTILKDFLLKFNKFIGEYVILNLHESEYYGLKFLNIMQHKTKKEHNEKIKIDKTDLKILSLLNQNSRISFVEISKKTNLTANSINNRIKKLEKSGRIEKYTVSIDWKKLDYEWHGIQLKLIKFNPETEKKLVSFFQQHKKVSFYYKYEAGQWDYDIGVIIKNSSELRDFINELRKTFASEIKISDVFLTLDETSSYKLPRGAFI